MLICNREAIMTPSPGLRQRPLAARRQQTSEKPFSTPICSLAYQPTGMGPPLITVKLCGFPLPNTGKQCISTEINLTSIYFNTPISFTRITPIYFYTPISFTCYLIICVTHCQILLLSKATFKGRDSYKKC